MDLRRAPSHQRLLANKHKSVTGPILPHNCDLRHAQFPQRVVHGQQVLHLTTCWDIRPQKVAEAQAKFILPHTFGHPTHAISAEGSANFYVSPHAGTSNTHKVAHAQTKFASHYRFGHPTCTIDLNRPKGSRLYRRRRAAAAERRKNEASTSQVFCRTSKNLITYMSTPV